MFHRITDEVKYRFLWRIGVLVSMLLYFSGVTYIYVFYRKVLLKNYRSIVLTYHRVRDDDKYSDISVKTTSFNRQLKYLKKHFQVIPLRKNVSFLQEKGNRTNDQVSISFDDGFQDNFSNALPILKRHHFPATIFLVSDLVGKSNDMLNIDQIKTMQSSQIDFGSHTVNHSILSHLKENEIVDEVLRSKQDLEEILHTEVFLFAYPKGKRRHYNETAKAELEKAGYLAAFTTENGPLSKADDLYELKRIGIRECPFFVFKARVSGIYESRPFLFFRNLLKLD